MNFSPFGVPFTGALPVTAQFAGGKLTQNLTTTNGQVVGVLSAGENGVHYIRPVDASSFAQAASPPHQQAGQQTQTLITLPITMPGAKPGDPQQTVQIQVVNPAPTTVSQASVQQPKYHISQIPIQTFPQGATVLTVAYNSQQDGIQILEGQQGLPEGVTVVAALQPQDLQLIQATQVQQQQQQQQREEDMKPMQDKGPNATPVALLKNESNKEDILGSTTSTITAVPANWQNGTVADYLSRMPTALPLSLHQFLKFSAETIKRESQIESSPLSGELDQSVEGGEEGTQLSIVAEIAGGEQEQDVDDPDKNPKKKKKYKKKPPKPRRPKPGQVHIATALDGTTLFCCPECHMAYPEKELLEQHLVGHKIERRFICDICGAGLKRKEHLERHKLGHNPDRPFICSVCMKGFKRKEHLNLHFVIHSGQKTEICEECGKGFYRKDHLRKHARSHVTRRVKEEMNQQAQQASLITKGAQVTIQVQMLF